MPRSKYSTIGEELVMDYPSVKQILRVISKQGMDSVMDGYFRIETVDAYVAEWIDKGYKLANTHYVGENPEGYIMLYVLVKQE